MSLHAKLITCEVLHVKNAVMSQPTCCLCWSCEGRFYDIGSDSYENPYGPPIGVALTSLASDSMTVAVSLTIPRGTLGLLASAICWLSPDVCVDIPSHTLHLVTLLPEVFLFFCKSLTHFWLYTYYRSWLAPIGWYSLQGLPFQIAIFSASDHEWEIHNTVTHVQ